jgi:hypothetical protein
MIIESILMGIFATYFMDIMGSYLVRKKIIYSLVEPEVVGRWFLYLFTGKFIHEDIRRTPSLKNEKFWSYISHYMIGIILAGIYLFLELNLSVIRENMWVSLIFGIATVLLPWLWLFPSIGIGFFASKAPNQYRYLKTSFVNHTNFGFGMLIWILSFHLYLYITN